MRIIYSIREEEFQYMSWFCNSLIESELFTEFGYLTGCIVTEHIKIDIKVYQGDHIKVS